MTLQEMLNILKTYNITTHVSWDIIKYDADNAIYKINDYLGTSYPKMSDVLQSPAHSYCTEINGKQIPIFPDRYILSVVIPFIASEILAREEEFTTVYNKYIMDVDNGLFAMFQNEFNRVPPVFRQSPDDGVFFENQRPSIPATMDTIGFKVHYHINLNEDSEFYTKDITMDTNYYTTRDTIVVKDITQPLVINERLGYYCYKFKGWSRDSRITTEPTMYKHGDVITNPFTDVHFYAVWDKQLTIMVGIDGYVSIKNEYIDQLKHLRLPSVVNGRPIKAIPMDFINHNSIQSITLPSTLEVIESGAFKSYTGEIIFPKYNEQTLSPNIRILTDAFDENCVINTIYLPRSVAAIATGAFKCTTSFYCEYVEHLKPAAWKNGWHTEGSPVVWEVTNG